MPSTNWQAYEWYQTPASFIRWGRMLLEEYHGYTPAWTAFEPCVGDGIICQGVPAVWKTNDLDPGWAADTHYDAGHSQLWELQHHFDLVMTNPAYRIAYETLYYGLLVAPVVCLHVRLSFLEPMKREAGQSKNILLRSFPPTTLAVLPRFPYQVSVNTGQPSQDNVTSAWMIWDRRHTTKLNWSRLLLAPDWLMEAAAEEAAARRAAFRTTPDETALRHHR